MALVTQNTYTGNGTLVQFSFTFPYLDEAEVKVSLDGVDVATTEYSLANATTVEFNTAPTSGQAIRIYRETDVEDIQATFFSGSAIRAQDLNDNFNQVFYATQETVDRRLDNTGGTMTGDIIMDDCDIVFEGATDDAHETTLTVVDPTADRTITLPDVTGTVVTTGDTGTVATGMVADSAITTAKIANSNVTTAKIADSNVTTAKIADSNVTTAKINNSAVTTDKLNNSSVTTAKIANSNVTTDKIADSNVTTAKIADSNVTTAKINDLAVTNDKIANGTITSAKLTGGTVVTNSEQSGATVNDTSFFTTSASDSRYFRQDSSETIASGDTWTGSDAFVATTGAIDARIIDLVDDVGGFVPIANETSFPTANPDVNNGAGTIVSVASIATTRTPSSGTVTIANGSGSNTVTITGCGSSDLESGYGMLVETTTTLHTYTFHRLVPRATEVTTVAGISADITTAATNVADISNFADVYQIEENSDPTQRADGSALQEGDLVFRKDTDVIRAYNGTSYQNITPDSATLADIAIVADDLATFEDLGLITQSLTAAQSGGALETCADNIADIRTLADIEDGTDATDAIQTVAGISSNVTTVAGVSSNVTTVAGSIANVNTVANDLNEATSEIDTVAGAIANVNNVGNDISNVNTVAGQISPTNNISTVAGISSNVSTVAGISSDVTTVAGKATEVESVADNISNVNTTAGSISNVNTVAGSITNVNTVASNISDVNNFADQYTISATQPASPSNGDLWYDSTNNLLKFYDGTSWNAISSGGIANIVEDTTPQLGGALDGQNNNLSNIGTIDGTNIQIDFGTI